MNWLRLFSLFAAMLTMISVIGLSYVSAQITIGGTTAPKRIINLGESATTTSSNINITSNSSQYWDNLNTPADISGSIYWYNQTYLPFFYNMTPSPFFYNQTASPYFYNQSTSTANFLRKDINDSKNYTLFLNPVINRSDWIDFNYNINGVSTRIARIGSYAVHEPLLSGDPRRIGLIAEPNMGACITTSDFTTRVCAEDNHGGQLSFIQSNVSVIALAAGELVLSSNVVQIENISGSGYINFYGNTTSAVNIKDANFVSRFSMDTINRIFHLQHMNLTGNLTGYFDGDCPTGNYSYGVGLNGTLKCAHDVSGASAGTPNIFNQNLNTTNNVIFAGANISGNLILNNNNITNISYLSIGTEPTINSNIVIQAFRNVASVELFRFGRSAAAGNYIGLISHTGTTGTNHVTMRLRSVTTDSIGFLMSTTSNYAVGDVILGTQNGSTQGLWADVSTGNTGFGPFFNLMNPKEKVHIKGSAIIEGYLNDSRGFSTNITIPFNGTGVMTGGVQLLVPHQSYDITSVTALNINYNNTLDRPIRLDIQVKTSVALLNDLAFVNMTRGYSQPLQQYTAMGFQSIGAALTVAVFNTGTITIQPGEQWAVNSTVGGSGAVVLEKVWKTVL